MSKRTLRRYSRDSDKVALTGAYGKPPLVAGTIVPLQQDHLSACAALMLNATSHKRAGMTQASALKCLEACIGHEQAVGAVLLNAWCQPVAFVMGHIECDLENAPTHIHLCELCVSRDSRRMGGGMRLVEFVCRQFNDTPASFSATLSRRRTKELIKLL